MKKKYLGLAVTSTLAFSMLATSAFAVNNADLLDGLDSTDFALATHAHSTSDVTGLDAELATKADQTDLDTAVAILENSDANPILPVNTVKPFTCQSVRYGWTATLVLPKLPQVRRTQQHMATCINGAGVQTAINYEPV